MPVLRARADRARGEGHLLRAGGDRPLGPPGVALREEPVGPGAGARGGHARPAGVARDHGVPRGSLSGAGAAAARSRAARARAVARLPLRRRARQGLLRVPPRRRQRARRAPGGVRSAARTGSRRSPICRGSSACATCSASSCRRTSPRGSTRCRSGRPFARSWTWSPRSEHRRAVRGGSTTRR